MVFFPLMDKHQPVKIFCLNSNLNFSGSSLQPAIVLPLSDKSTESPAFPHWDYPHPVRSCVPGSFLISSEFFQSLTAADGGDRLRVTMLARAGGYSQG